MQEHRDVAKIALQTVLVLASAFLGCYLLVGTCKNATWRQSTALFGIGQAPLGLMRSGVDCVSFGAVLIAGTSVKLHPATLSVNLVADTG